MNEKHSDCPAVHEAILAKGIEEMAKPNTCFAIAVIAITAPAIALLFYALG